MDVPQQFKQYVLTESKRKEMQVELDTFQTSKQNNSRKSKRKKVVIKERDNWCAKKTQSTKVKHAEPT